MSRSLLSEATRLCCSVWFAGAVVIAAAAEPAVRIDHRVFPGLHEMDGNWAALLAASDGKVYAGLPITAATGTWSTTIRKRTACTMSAT